MKKNYTYFLVLIFLLFSFSAHADTQHKAKINLYKEHIKIRKNSDGKLTIVNQHYIEKELLTSDAQGYANHIIHYSDTWQKIKKIETHVLRKKGKKYKKEKFDHVITKSSMNTSIFYDDHKNKEIIAPRMNVGDKIVIMYEEEIVDPHFLGSFFFSSYIPIEYTELKINHTDDILVDFKQFHVNDLKLTYQTEKLKEQSVKVWKAVNIPPYKIVSHGPNFRYYEPHIAPYITSYQSKNEEITVLGSPESLFKWYNSLVKNVNQNESSTLKAIVDSITSNTKSKKEITKKIFYWVQDHIKYVAFEDGLGGFIPREANDICDKRYGDCKDMASIITEMLKYANIEGYLTWVGSRDIPYRYTEMPTPAVDNHMIASVKLDDNYIFLDATGSYVPFGSPTGFIQGKEALIKTGEKSFSIVEVPVISREENRFNDTTLIKLLKNSSVEGKTKTTLQGLEKYNMTWSLINKSQKDQKDVLKSKFEKGNNKFLVNQFTIDNLEDRDLDLSVDFTFTIGDYYKKVGDNLYLNPHISKPWKDQKIEIEERENIPLEFDHKFTKNFVTTFEIEDDYKIVFTPKNKRYSTDQFGYNISYEVKDNKFICEMSYFLDTLLLTSDQFEAWNKMIDQLNEIYSEAIILQEL